MRHLVGRLQRGDYKVPGEEAERRESVEFRIQQLETCNFHWDRNMEILLKEIAAGRQIAPWHTPDGFNAHGDVPDRRSVLQPILHEVTAWMTGTDDGAGQWGQVLGPTMPEKRWLAACLCKNIKAQHAGQGLEAKIPETAMP